MEQVIVGGYIDDINSSTTEYNTLSGGYTWENTEVERRGVISTDGILKNLRIKLETAPGAGKEFVFTLRVNGAASALTVTLSDAENEDSDIIHEVDVVPGDLVSLECNADNLPATGYALWSLMFEGDTSNESIILGNTGDTLATYTSEYSMISPSYASLIGASDTRIQVIPTDGYIQDLFVQLSEDPGTDPDGYSFTLQLDNGGGWGDTALTVTITADDTTGSDVAHSIDVSQGDLVRLKIVPLNSPSNSPYASWGFTFVADTDGESLILGSSSNDLHTTNTEYNALQLTVAYTIWGAEANHYEIGQVTTLKKLTIDLETAPGAEKHFDFTTRVEGGDGNLTVEVADAATTGSDNVNTDVLSAYDILSIKCVPDNSPAVGMAYWACVGYIAPSGGEPQPDPEPEVTYRLRPLD